MYALLSRCGPEPRVTLTQTRESAGERRKDIAAAATAAAAAADAKLKAYRCTSGTLDANDVASFTMIVPSYEDHSVGRVTQRIYTAP